MRYRSTLFRIFSYLFVLFVGMSLIGSAQALTLPDGQRGPFQSGKVQVILGADPGTVPDYCGMIAREERIIGFLTQYQLDAKGEPSLSRESITRQLHISDLYPSVVTNERRQLLDTILKNRVNKSFHQDIGRNLLMPVSGTGTVTYIDLEGGFFGIITDDGAQLRPASLPEEFRVDRLRVRFTAIPATGTAGIYMWGTAVQVLQIEKDTESITASGTVTYIDLEGGFFGIITDDGAQLRPASLPEEFQVDGLRVRFTAIPATGTAGIYMWGTAVQVFQIEKDTESITASGTVTYIELEGGFFGIITDDGAKFLPLNLPDRYACDGTEVEFTAVIAHDTTTFAMWGVPVNLLSITSIEGEDTGEQSYITGSWICTGYRAGTALQSPITGTEIIADFGTNGMVTGTTGCNVYFAEYVAGDTSLDIENAGMTEMYCLGPDGIMEQEQLFLNLLCSAETFDITNGQLKIRDATGRKILLFDRIGIESENN